jgi:hypothetical protein
MYYDRILRAWSFDCFLISAIIGNFTGRHIKKYLTERKAMEQLKNSIIKK